MKWIFYSAVIAVTLLTACNNDTGKSPTEAKISKDTVHTNALESKAATTKEVVSQYFHLKNALANDDGKESAVAGKEIVEAIDKFDVSSLAADQKKVFRDLGDDMRENAEHIGSNADKISHQREHFEMLSKDMYDLVKKLGAGQIVYQDYCPMYNNKKGATWISETMEIKNPYLGKQMPTCGTVKEEIK